MNEPPKKWKNEVSSLWRLDGYGTCFRLWFETGPWKKQQLEICVRNSRAVNLESCWSAHVVVGIVPCWIYWRSGFPISVVVAKCLPPSWPKSTRIWSVLQDYQTSLQLTMSGCPNSVDGSKPSLHELPFDITPAVFFTWQSTKFDVTMLQSTAKVIACIASLGG